MAKLNPTAKTPLTHTTTHEGGSAVEHKPYDELLFTAATTYLGEDTFYEYAPDRLERLNDLVTKLALNKNHARSFPLFIHHLRTKYNIRTATIAIACIYAREHQLTSYPYGSDLVAEAINVACGRADEPAEVVAFWQTYFGEEIHGRRKAKLPTPVRRGLTLAVKRLYSERSVLKWDSTNKVVRMGDVIELVHPTPANPRQSELWKFLLDQRHHGDGMARMATSSGMTNLSVIATHAHLASINPEARRNRLRLSGPKVLADAGFTWERLSSWLPGGMDAEAWEAVIPSMGVMALLRNLRNFDQAGISEAAKEKVIAKITNPENVSGAKIMPYRAWQAYHHAPSDDWKRALGKTVDLASGNVPSFDRALILVDTSGSMLHGSMSFKSMARYVDLAALQALTVARASTNTEVVIFASESAPYQVRLGASLLTEVDRMRATVGSVGGATYGNAAITRHYTPERHDHVLVFTDGQFHDSHNAVIHVPSIVTFDIAGYAARSSWGKGRIHVAGFSDQVFTVIHDLLYTGD